MVGLVSVKAATTPHTGNNPNKYNLYALIDLI